jgi:hypothetical protein
MAYDGAQKAFPVELEEEEPLAISACPGSHIAAYIPIEQTSQLEGR